MCYPVQCGECGKTTWSGCGMHVDQVMRDVPAAQRCDGHRVTRKAPLPEQGSFLSRLLGRR
ncbi:hypothetical protein [Hoyosella altamirensis]|uniref:Uncharacterized protein n=1 Tax=Hoyosella altamirensis TaxID=616997 RepID=A0A839RNW5_9ACTN|nr:hypothetical protein [Hoyosella altamirensis]MBB3038200.1 hypothetical protein [Hoyosella altamirensis]